MLANSLKFFLCLSLLVPTLSAFAASSPSTQPKNRAADFAALEKRARAGEKLNVIFFGASLTWGANASDPTLTSYRAQVARRFEAAYPKAHFKFWDAAIGGTGSQLGVFRLERDVLGRSPDLVFLDFSANDDIYSADEETLASYESLVRRLVLRGVPVVQVIFPFKWNIKTGEMAKMKRREAHLQISRAYNTAVGDAIALISARVESGQANVEELWPFDGAHPDDNGYALFAEAAWQGFQDGIKKRTVCRAPSTLLHAPTYMTWKRARISQLGPLPAGWRVGTVSRTSAFFDFLMSRWLDDSVIASTDSAATSEVQRLRFQFNGSTVMIFGESTPQSGQYRVYLDGQLIERTLNGKTQSEFDPGAFAKLIGGNGHHAQLITTGLATDKTHNLEIEPIFTQSSKQELRLESICVAGGLATVEGK